MTEPGSALPAIGSTPRSHRKRRLLFIGFCIIGMVVAIPLAAYLWASSNAAQEIVRRRMVALLEQSTGGHAQITSFHWRLLNLEAEADGLVLHGTEPPGEQPLAQADSLRASLSILGLWSPRILLRDLTIVHPAVHVMVFPDGSTNVPHPRKPAKRSHPVLDTLFELQAGHVSVQQGMLHFENRAAEFDAQNRYAPLDFEAHDLSALARYLPPAGSTPETYRIETGATNLSLFRAAEKPAIGSVQATLDLARSTATLRSLRITSSFPSGKAKRADGHTLEFSGVLENFAHPSWKMRTTGELDMRLLEPALGYPSTPQGIAHLDLDSAGSGGEFRTDGTVHIDDASYIDTGVVATGMRVDAHVHADPRRLLIYQVVARLHEGGQLQCEVDLSPWLPNNPAATTIEGVGMNSVRGTPPGPQRPLRTPPASAKGISVPMNGKVRAEFKDVTLDALLAMVSPKPFQRLGFNTLLQGEAHASWVKGDQQTLVVDAALNLNDAAPSVAGEVAAAGAIDAIYTQRDGAVMVRKLAVKTPASTIGVGGHLGAYPLTSPSGLTVDFHSHELGEFDTLLRDLGLVRYGKAGARALPVDLTGQGEFHGNWTGSILDPHLAGTATASQIAIEMIPVANVTENGASASPGASAQPTFVHWDSVEATGSYNAEHIALQHSSLRRGSAAITLDGALDATPPHAGHPEPEFDANSELRMHVTADQVQLNDLLGLLGRKIPLSGILSANLQTEGALHALNGAGWVELNQATAYGEPITQIRAEGSLTGPLLKITAGSASAPAGTVAATGTYEIAAKRFHIDSRGNGIDIAKIEALRREVSSAVGTMAFTLSGSGTLDDPHLDAHASLNGLELGGESLGALVFAGHTANRSVNYNATTRLEGAKIDLNGETALSGDYATQARLQFSHFDIGGLLKAAQVRGLTGESALAGSMTIEGPLARPLDLHGDARLQQLDATIAGVHLASQGGVHATLADGRISLDPLHVTGEDTDLHARGSIAFKEKQQLDFAAGGSINLKLAETVDPDLTARGSTTFQVEAHGTLKDPGLTGRIDFKDGSLSLEDVPNGLSQLHGTLEFNQNRLEVKSLTAMSGGGLLSVGGYLAYQHGLFADLSVTGSGIRIRYPAGVSSLADTTLHLQGSQNNLLLSGDVLITRFSVSPDLDVAALAAQTSAVQTVAAPDAPSNHIRLDVRVSSSPQLNFQNAFAKLAGNVDLRLRGTVASPSLLGRVSITEGSAIIAGTRYDLERGDVFFTNPVRIEPSIDLNATARVEDYDITLGLHGTPQKMAVTYRSDPPLPEADVVALLALGRTENQQRLYTAQQEQYVANPTTDALLGGALNATVSSRVQRLFGASSVKVDPNYIGTLGNSTSRITVEEQLGRNVTLTYATDVDTTGQQLLQAEIAVNRHVSLLIARDESGVFSMVLKATRRYR